MGASGVGGFDHFVVGGVGGGDDRFGVVSGAGGDDFAMKAGKEKVGEREAGVFREGCLGGVGWYNQAGGCGPRDIGAWLMWGLD